jgi:hypothetical protein
MDARPRWLVVGNLVDYVRNVFEKLGVHDRRVAGLLAAKLGLMPPDEPRRG